MQKEHCTKNKFWCCLPLHQDFLGHLVHLVHLDYPGGNRSDWMLFDDTVQQHDRLCLATFPNASRFIQNTPLRAVFFNSQSVSLVVCTCGEAHSVSCLICFIFSHPKMLTILQCYLLSIFLQTQTVVVEVSLMKTCLCVRASLIAADKSSGIILLAN